MSKKIAAWFLILLAWSFLTLIASAFIAIAFNFPDAPSLALGGGIVAAFLWSIHEVTR